MTEKQKLDYIKSAKEKVWKVHEEILYEDKDYYGESVLWNAMVYLTKYIMDKEEMDK